MIGLTVACLLVGGIAALGIALLDLSAALLLGRHHGPVALDGATITRLANRSAKRLAAGLHIGDRSKAGFARNRCGSGLIGLVHNRLALHLRHQNCLLLHHRSIRYNGLAGDRGLGKIVLPLGRCVFAVRGLDVFTGGQGRYGGRIGLPVRCGLRSQRYFETRRLRQNGHVGRGCGGRGDG